MVPEPRGVGARRHPRADEEQQIVEATSAPGRCSGEPAGHRIQEILPGWPRTRTHRQRRHGPRRTRSRARRDHDTGQRRGGPGDPFVAVYLRDAAPGSRARRSPPGLARRTSVAARHSRSTTTSSRDSWRGVRPRAGADPHVHGLPRPDPGCGAGDDGRPARTPRRRGAAARRPRAHHAGGHRCAPRSRRPHHWRTPSDRKTPTGSLSWTTPKTCGCCCARGWRPATG